MEITLPPNLEQFVETQVRCGNYTSAHAVILASIELLAQQQVQGAVGSTYIPKRPLTQKLQAIRQRSINSGMALMSANDIAMELNEDRNRVSSP